MAGSVVLIFNYLLVSNLETDIFFHHEPSVAGSRLPNGPLCSILFTVCVHFCMIASGLIASAGGQIL